MTFGRLLALARPHRRALSLMTLLTLAESAALLLLPALAGRVAGDVLAGSEAALGPAVALLLGALAGVALLRGVAAAVSGRTSARLLADLRVHVHDHLQALPLSVHQRHGQGDFLALSTYECRRLGELLTVTLAGLPAQVLTALGAVVLMARIDLALALAVPALMPIFVVALKVVGRRLRALGLAQREAEAEVVIAAAEDLAMLPAIKSFTREGAASRRFAARAGAARDLLIREADIQAVVGPLSRLVAGVAAVLLLALAGQGVQSGAMSAAETVSLLLYAALLTQPVAALAQVYGRLQAARGTLARLAAVLDAGPEPGHDAPRRLRRARGAVDVEGVSFAYPGRDPVLRNLSLSVRPGEVVALTGPNGAGKSTLMALLQRFEDPDEGTVRIDGIDLRDIALPDLRRQIGWVPQRPLLFDGTVRDNIAFGRDGATEAEIVEAARLAQAHGFIAALPLSYDTPVGEHGARLSGGQGQRLALARAILKDPPILILDEATSMYDLDGEGAFVAAAATALRGRTVLLIAHRPATLALADRVVTLEEGRIRAERSAA